MKEARKSARRIPVQMETSEKRRPVMTGTPQVFRHVADGMSASSPDSVAFGNGVRFAVLVEEVERGSFFRGELGGFGNFLLWNRRRHFRQQLNAAVVLESSARRDKAAHDDVLLEAAQIVNLSSNGRFGKDAGGLLEARGGDERVGRERGLGDTKEQRTSGCGTATLGDDAVVLFAEAELVHLLLEQERRVANVFDFDPAHHLPGNGFDVLVVDVHALQAVDLLNGVYEVSLGELFSKHGQQIVQVERAVDQSFAGFDVVAFLHVDVDTARDGVFLGGLAVFAFDVNLAHTFSDVAVADAAIDFADDRGILGLAGFEEFDDARKTAGNVLGLGGFARDFGQHVTRLNFVAVLDHQVSARRHEVFFANLTARIADEDRGLMFFVARRQGNHVLREAGDFVDLFLDRDARLQIVKPDRAGGFREDREGERIPLGQNLAVRDVFAVNDAETRAVNHVIALFFAAFFVHDGNQAGAVHGDGGSAAAFNEFELDEFHDAVVASLESGTLGDAGGCSADVEGAHGELRAGFADG